MERGRGGVGRVGWLERLRTKLKGQSDLHPALRRLPPEPSIWEVLTNHPDALGVLAFIERKPENRYRTQIGYANGEWRMTEPKTHTLVLGPSQSAAGKTSGYMIPTVLTRPGPVVCSSTKFDIARNTAMARSRTGTVWHYDPTGAPPPPGFKELRWSPIADCKDWNTALEIARYMVAAADSNAHAAGRTSSESANFFQERSADLIACVMHYAALTGKDMGFVVSRISAGMLAEEFKPMYEELERLGSEEAYRKLYGIVWANDRSRSDVFQTADVALRGYQGKALRSATEVNFDPFVFVMGEPFFPSDMYAQLLPGNSVIDQVTAPPRILGRYDTVYITVPADKQRLYAPLVIGLLSAIKRAVYTLHELEERTDHVEVHQPVTFVLDEMYGSPLPDLTALLSEGGGQGLIMCGALQDLSQAHARWGEAGKGFLTLWQNVLVLPGIRDKDTLELLSLLIGDYDHTYIAQGWSQQANFGPTGPPMAWTQSRQEHRERRRYMPPDQIYTGNPKDPDEVLLFTPNGGWQQVRLMKYWTGAPWPGILLQSAGHVLQGVHYENQLGHYAENWALPLPNLMRGGNPDALFKSGGQDMVNWFSAIQQDWKRKQRRTPELSGPPPTISS
jgi:type IV secretory pathway TraG/TraD family ATPase VirD4